LSTFMTKSFNAIRNSAGITTNFKSCTFTPQGPENQSNRKKR
jgi:hypothetical protein